MTAIKEHRDSIQLNQVFPTKGEDVAGKDCDTTESPSDSDHSLLGNSVSSRGSTSILRVTTVEESLAHLDIERSQSSGSAGSAASSSEEDGGTAAVAVAVAVPEDEAVAVAVPEEEDEDDEEEETSRYSMNASHKSVTFTSVEVREYPICLGDNPSVMIGAPLSIEWEAQSAGKLSVEDYETSRPERRRSEELRIPSFVREEMLRNNGYSRLDIQKGVRDVNIARNMRKRTNETHRLHKAQEIAEKLVRGTLNATLRRSKKKQEKDLINHFRTEAKTLVQKQSGGPVRRSTWHAGPAPTINKRGTSVLLQRQASLSSGLDAAAAATNSVEA